MTATIIINSFLLGLLFLCITALIFLHFNSKNKTYLAILLIGIFSSIFICGEIAAVICFIHNKILLGRFLHRIQALSASYFIVGIPLIVKNLIQLTHVKKIINNILLYSGIIIFTIIAISAFVEPDLFISQTKGLEKSVTICWTKVRGEAGKLYYLRDIMNFISILYLITILSIEVFWHKRYKYILLPFIGCIITTTLVITNLLHLYKYINLHVAKELATTLTTIGITIFAFFFMLTIIQKFIAQAKRVEDAKKIESLGIFAGGVAHDFNNLLTAIIGNVSLAKYTFQEQNMSELYTMLSDIENVSENAKKLTQQLLSFSKGGAPVKDVTSIKKLIIDTIKFLLRGTSIHCEFSIPDNLKNVNIDQGQISQVIHNIILNAMQAMHNKGKIYVSAEINKRDLIKFIPGSTKNEFIKITIKDSGPGIEKKHIEKLFDPYFTTKDLGHGLGLTAVYTIVKKHDGFIFVESEINSGTEIIIFLPTTKEETKKPNSTKVKKYNFSGKILIMDDENYIISILNKMLIKLGFEVKAVNDGENAIAEYKKSLSKNDPYDCLIMDLTIPGGMNGIETIKKLKTINPDVKAIVSSGYSGDTTLANYKEHGFSRMLTKPYNFTDLQKTLAEILKK